MSIRTWLTAVTTLSPAVKTGPSGSYDKMHCAMFCGAQMTNPLAAKGKKSNSMIGLPFAFGKNVMS